MDSVIPTEIRRANQHDIEILWNDGLSCVYEARQLRLACPCAVCVDEMTGRRVLQESTVSEDVNPKSIELVGRYAIRVWWSDGHSSGLYPFRQLRELCGPGPIA